MQQMQFSITSDSLVHLVTRLREHSQQMSEISARLNALEEALDRFSQLHPETDVAPVEPKEKRDLEIFEQNIDDSIKNNYIDLDEITNGKELWEPYDANWWNK